MIIYSRYNSGRKKEFRLITTIEKNEDGTLFSSKKAQGKEAKPFLSSLVSKYNLLMKHNFSVKPLRLKKINESRVDFEFCVHKSLSNFLLQALMKKNKKEFVGILDRYVEVIKENKLSEETLSAEFQKIFGEYKGRKKMDCLKPGCLDLNFDNMRHDDKNKEYCLLDYEWTFDFPIPYKYIIFRAINDFYYKNRAYNPSKLAQFDELLDRFQIKEKEIFFGFEYNFLKYVLGDNMISDLRVYRKHLNEIQGGGYPSEEQKLLGFGRAIQEKEFEVQRKNQEIRRLRQMAQKRDRIIQEKERVIREKKARIDFMESSKFWKIRGKYINFKRKLRIK